jgi:hypothetical protein
VNRKLLIALVAAVLVVGGGVAFAVAYGGGAPTTPAPSMPRVFTLGQGRCLQVKAIELNPELAPVDNVYVAEVPFEFRSDFPATQLATREVDLAVAWKALGETTWFFGERFTSPALPKWLSDGYDFLGVSRTQHPRIDAWYRAMKARGFVGLAGGALEIFTRRSGPGRIDLHGFPLHGEPGVEVTVAMFDADGSMIERTVHLSCPKLKNYGGPSNNN